MKRYYIYIMNDETMHFDFIMSIDDYDMATTLACTLSKSSDNSVHVYDTWCHARVASYKNGIDVTLSIKGKQK